MPCTGSCNFGDGCNCGADPNGMTPCFGVEGDSLLEDILLEVDEQDEHTRSCSKCIFGNACAKVS